MIFPALFRALERVLFLNLFALLAPIGLFAQADLPWLLPPSEGYAYTGQRGTYPLMQKDDRLYVLTAEGALTALPYEAAKPKGVFWEVSKNGLLGLWHPEQGELLPPVFQKIGLLSDSLFTVGKYGMNALVNVKNELVMPYQKQAFRKIGGGLIGTGGRQGMAIYDHSGQEVPFSEVSKIEYLGYGCYRIVKDKQVSVLNHKGEVVFPTGYNEYHLIDENRAQVQQKGQWGIINRAGTVLVPLAYATLSLPKPDAVYPWVAVRRTDGQGMDLISHDLSIRRLGNYESVLLPNSPEGLIHVKKDGRYGCLEPDNFKEVIPLTYTRPLGCGACPVLIGELEGDRQYLNKRGKSITSMKLADAKPFYCGLAMVREDGKNWGLINEKGDYVFPPQFNSIEPLSFPAYLAKDQQGLFHFLLPDGRDVLLEDVAQIDTQRKLDNPIPFVGLSGKKGFLSQSGELLVPAVLDEAEPFSGGMAPARYQGQWGVLKLKQAPESEE